MNHYFIGRRGEVPLRLVAATSRLAALARVKLEHNGTIHHSGNRNAVLHGSTLGDSLIATEAVRVDEEWVEED